MQAGGEGATKDKMSKLWKTVQSMGFQRVRNDLATDHQQMDSMLIVPNVKVAKRVNFEGSHHKEKKW